MPWMNVYVGVIWYILQEKMKKHGLFYKIGEIRLNLEFRIYNLEFRIKNTLTYFSTEL
jgi:hypothetical protein